MASRCADSARSGIMRSCCCDAGVAQLVERNLAKVEVASSRLVSRSSFPGRAAYALPFRLTGRDNDCRDRAQSLAGWQSGYAAACKAVDAGSIPTPASIASYAAKFPEIAAALVRSASLWDGRAKR